jgi:hypothetical protein
MEPIFTEALKSGVTACIAVYLVWRLSEGLVKIEQAVEKLREEVQELRADLSAPGLPFPNARRQRERSENGK